MPLGFSGRGRGRPAEPMSAHDGGSGLFGHLYDPLMELPENLGLGRLRAQMLRGAGAGARHRNRQEYLPVPAFRGAPPRNRLGRGHALPVAIHHENAAKSIAERLSEPSNLYRDLPRNTTLLLQIRTRRSFGPTHQETRYILSGAFTPSRSRPDRSTVLVAAHRASRRCLVSSSSTSTRCTV